MYFETRDRFPPPSIFITLFRPFYKRYLFKPLPLYNVLEINSIFLLKFSCHNNQLQRPISKGNLPSTLEVSYACV